MLFKRCSVLLISLTLLQAFVELVVCAPPVLGIQRDWFTTENDRETTYSYSTIIKFKVESMVNGKYPSEFMTDEQMIGMLDTAFAEMKSVHAAHGLSYDFQPKAMLALAIKDRIYFASSMKSGIQSFYRLKPSAPKEPPSVQDQTKQIISDALSICQKSSDMKHRTGWGCGEPNVLDLWVEDKLPGFDDRGTSNLRIIDWIVFPGNNGKPFNNGPCKTPVGGWGCGDLIKGLGGLGFTVPAVAKKTQDGDGSIWDGQWTTTPNPRELINPVIKPGT